MWTVKANAEFDQRQRKLQKQGRSRELAVVARNLERYLQALELGTKPKQIQCGWVHQEPLDIFAITEKGANEVLGKNKAKGLVPTRLYVFPEIEKQILHAITVGDKSTQHDDIQYSKQYVRAVLAERERERLHEAG
jgi:hypothetical protein